MSARPPHHPHNEIAATINRVCAQTKVLASLYDYMKPNTNIATKTYFTTFSHDRPFDANWDDGSRALHPKEFAIHYLKAYSRSYKLLVCDELVFLIFKLVIRMCEILTRSIAVTPDNINRIVFAACILAIKWTEDSVPAMSGFLFCCPLEFQVRVLIDKAHTIELFSFVNVFKCHLPLFE